MDGSSHRPWSTVLLVLHGIAVAGGLLALVSGVVLLVVSVTTPAPTEGIYEPYGLVIGAVLAALGAVALLVSGVLTALIVRGRRAADAGRPGTLRGATIAALVIAGLGPLSALTSGDLVTLVMLLIPAGVVALPAIRVLQMTGAGRVHAPE